MWGKTYLFFGPIDFVGWGFANSLPFLCQSLAWLCVILFDHKVRLRWRVKVAGLRILSLSVLSENHHVI